MKTLFSAIAATMMTGAALAETMDVPTTLAVFDIASTASSACALQFKYQPASDALFGKDCSNFYDVVLPKLKFAVDYFDKNQSSFKEYQKVLISVDADNIEENLIKISIYTEDITK